MVRQLKQTSYVLPIKLVPNRDEGPQGYLCRVAESNLLTVQDLKAIGISYDYDQMVNHDLLVSSSLDPDLHQQVQHYSSLWHNEIKVWNVQYARFCPHCLVESGYWKVEWELNFYDVCHLHHVFLVDQCSSCGRKVTWQRALLNRCSCGSILHAEETKACPQSMIEISKVISNKIHQSDDQNMPIVLLKTNIEQTQRTIRYLGNYMSLAAAKNPLKMRQAGDLNQSLQVTSLAAEVIAGWPDIFHDALTQLERKGRSTGRPSLNEVFGQAYHYVFKTLKGGAFEELRHQFELWINQAWKGGLAKRNKRLRAAILKDAAWIPANAACDYLGISHQRLELLIREGTLEGETYISDKGRRFVTVRRDNLEQIKQNLFGYIDMTIAGRLLGLQKRRMRLLLKLIFTEAKKLGTSPSSAWAVSRSEVNKLIDLTIGCEVVSIPDEGCVSLAHILRYWTWTNEDIASLISAIKSEEMKVINVLDTASGIAAWNFNVLDLKNWKLKTQNGMGNWLTITQAAKLLGIKEQVAYELVTLGFLHAEIMPMQVKRGVRIKRKTLEAFEEKYIFSTKIAEHFGCSSRKIIAKLGERGINPVSGPQINQSRQVLYLFDDTVREMISGEDAIKNFELTKSKSINNE